MTLLIIGIVVLLGIHLVPAIGDVRDRLIGRLGETGYRVLFSLVSTAGLVLLVWGFARAPVIQVWSPPPGRAMWRWSSCCRPSSC